MRIDVRRIGGFGAMVCAGIMLSGAASAQVKLIEQAGFPAPDLTNIMNLIADKAGFLKGEGLEVEVRFSTGGPQATQITASGGADIGEVTLEPLIEGYDKGIRGKLFFAEYTRLIYHIAVPADSSIQSIADLKGKKIGVTNMGSASLVVARSALRKSNVPIEADMFRPVGFGDGAVAALRSGQVQALSMWTSAYGSMMKAGMALRFLYHPTVAEIGNGGYFASDKTLAEKRDSLIRFGRAHAKATVFLLENPEAALRMHWKYNPASKPAGTDEEAIKRGMIEMNALLSQYSIERHSDKRYGFTDMDGVRTYIGLFTEEGVISRPVQAQDIATNDLLDEINKFDEAKVRELARSWK
ncbi:ABC transporter substrate-binding protein [Rhodoplanes sp. Z2-YC6860]|uniref:ABC transporter substrate-binding protein n=1 Tax=Rhodoplanes sp. Z2-YC6860 TaxID=674703 RepID=UPI00078D73C8|nr:ABC transporter substrate-binding protein [Rhodoplanes sp. Z2-YC6860]AMN40427.1 extracellular solute-binding protein, family 1 [Rhodoplanes sp. Z2-YC6860]